MGFYNSEYRSGYSGSVSTTRYDSAHNAQMYHLGQDQKSWDDRNKSGNIVSTGVGVRGTGGLTFIAIVCGTIVIVHFIDQLIVGFAGILLGTASIAFVLKWATFTGMSRLRKRLLATIAASVPLIASASVEYIIYAIDLPPLALSTRSWNWIEAASSAHPFAFWIGFAGVLLAFVAVFTATNKEELLGAPTGLLIVTALCVIWIIAFSDSAGNASITSTSVPPPVNGPTPIKSDSESTASITGKEPAAKSANPMRAELSGTQYVTVDTNSGPLRLRSCPVTCAVVASLPKGTTVKVVGGDAKGWREIETAGPGGTMLRGFASGQFLK